MIAIAKMQTDAFGVAQPRRSVMRVAEDLRDSAAKELSVALDGVSTKRVKSASVFGAGATFLSRAQNGDSSNPLFRLASLFVLGRTIGVPKERFQRILDWLQTRLDEAYADQPKPSVKEVLETASELDPRDDHLRYMAAQGCAESRARLVEETRVQMAFARTVIYTLETVG